MKLRRRPISSSALLSLFFFVPVVTGALVACGSDDDTGNGATDSGTDAPFTANPDGSPITADAAVRPDGAVGSGDAATNPDATVTSGDGGGDAGESEDGGGDATTGGGNDGGTDAATDGGGVGTVDAAAPDAGPDAGPIVQMNFPLATPGLGGYALVDVFPSAEPLDIPAAITWAKTDTTNAHAFVLERTGQIRRMADNGTWDYQHPIVDFSKKVNVEGEGGAVGHDPAPEVRRRHRHARLHLRLVQRLRPHQPERPLRVRDVLAEARTLHLPPRRRHGHALRRHAHPLHRGVGVPAHPQRRPHALRPHRWIFVLRQR